MTVLDGTKRFFYNHLRSSILAFKIAKNPMLSDFYPMKIFLDRKIRKVNNALYTLPPKLIIENTNICNAACIMCPYMKMVRRKGIMSFELFKKIVNEYATSTHIKRLQMNSIGEPLLDASLIRKIRYAKEKGIDKVFFFTNGSLLDKKISEELIDSGLDYMIISMDGITKEIYEKIRVNLKFEKVTNNITNFLVLRERKDSNRPKIELHLTLFNKNRHSEKNFVKKLKNLVDYVSIAYAHDWAGQQEVQNIEYAQKSRQTKLVPCSNLWSELTILWDGLVALCCIDYEGKVVLGDVNKQTLKSVWTSEKLQRIREYHLKRQFNQIELCKICSEHTLVNWLLDY